jgi:DNA-directed RNA polymerase specialized sigma24 family protein
MVNDFSGLATMVFDCRPPADQADVIDQCIAHCRSILLGSARRLIARYQLVDPAFDEDDAVQGAFLMSFQAIADGKMTGVETDGQLLRLARHKLRQELQHEREREQTLKRGGDGASRVVLKPVADDAASEIEIVNHGAATPDERAIAEDELERWLTRLDARDRTLRPIATAMAEGLTYQEMAVRLGLSPAAVDHKVRLIRAILSAWNTEHA